MYRVPRIATTLPQWGDDEGQFQTIVENVPVFISIADREGNVTYVNQTAREWVGLAPDESPHGWKLSPDEMDLLAHAAKHGEWRGERENFLSGRPGAGPDRTVLQTIVAHKDAEGRVAYFSTIAKDISERKRLERERLHLLSVIEESPVSVSTAAPGGRLLFLNRAARALLGLAQDENIDAIRTLDIYAPWAARLLVEEALPTAAREGQWEGETAVMSRDGREVHVIQSIVAHRAGDGTVHYYSTIVKDITKRKQREEQLQHEATHDGLTGAMNRAYFEKRLRDELVLAQHAGDPGAVVHLDLDEFKEINDTYGHHAGDLVLQNIVRVVQHHLRDTDIFARLGGDEFAIVLPQTTRVQAAPIARRLLKALTNAEVEFNGHTIRVGGSMGIAEYPQDGTTVEEVLMQADTAMYTAKRKGGNRVAK